MADRQSTPPTKVTLEDLLHLKRAERPAPEFWSEFERELRQKQLAALVVRKSWWLELSGAYSRFGRLRLPLGAAAVLALSFLTVRYYGPSGASNSTMADVNPLNRADPAAAQPPRCGREPARFAAPAQPRHRRGAGFRHDREKPGGGGGDAPVRQGKVSQVIPWLGDVVDDRARSTDLTPSARSIAVRLAAAAAIEPELVDAVARPLDFEERAMPAARLRHTAELLPTAAAVTDSRRTRLLAALGLGGGLRPRTSGTGARQAQRAALPDGGWVGSFHEPPRSRGRQIVDQVLAGGAAGRREITTAPRPRAGLCFSRVFS